MHLNADISSALQLLEDIKQTVDDLTDPKLQVNTYQDLNLLISVLENPVFRSIVTVQDSLSELNQQLGQHPSILPVDFDITAAGELVLNVPPAGELYDPDYTDDYPPSRDFDEQRVPSAPISPSSPQVSTFSGSDNKMLLLNTQKLNGNLCNTESLRILQNNPTFNAHDDEIIHRSPSVGSDASKTGSDNLMSSEWSQVESIDLINDGTGLGFGILGMRNMGVVVKTILPGGVADRDGRLQSGDHILQIGDVNLHEMNSEQVATVLRQSGTHVRLIVARPVDISSTEYKYLGSSAPLVPTRLLHDCAELDRYLIQHKYPPIFQKSVDTVTDVFPPDISKSYGITGLSRVPASPSLPLLNLDLAVKMPEMEKFVVELKKDANGLGITIAGYVCEKEELSGIFVKSVSKGSAADISGRIKVNDRIVEVDGQSLQGYTNLQAVEVLRNCGNVVKLCLERYLHGPKYEQLQQAIAASEIKPASPSLPPDVPRFPKEEGSLILNGDSKDDSIQTHNEIFTSFNKKEEPAREPVNEELLRKKWEKLMGPDTEIVIAQLTKFGEKGGLGISLEGTVDVEDGQEVRPHHYIRSILPEGPVGKNGTLKSGDELLEVNGHKLLGMNHHEVVSILKELPVNVCMVCGRSPINLFAQRDDPFAERASLSRSLHNLLPASDRLVKAKSDGSLASSIAVVGPSDQSFTKMKSRSLEPLTGLAMWSSEPQIIELVKGERGLGFSILDYQDPIDPNDTVIVIRSLVPGGVAQLDGRLIPGDRLLFVNDTVLENASLDQAVQALKGAPKGIVRIGVAKPLPIPDTVAHSSLVDVDPNRYVTTNSVLN
ncbi:patj homolog [Anoplophora glabripennis]|uniref:patj homolog n=1 Tax=Anoplophora glabripennis TaxID=217634 RepID=UPI000873B90B|nr:patj homolog [Anoplophora glabripennis]